MDTHPTPFLSVIVIIMVYVNEGWERTGHIDLSNGVSFNVTNNYVGGIKDVIHFYSNKTRTLNEPHYYVWSHEKVLGPFVSWVEANAEVLYLNDKYGNDYIPNMEYKIFYINHLGKRVFV